MKRLAAMVVMLMGLGAGVANAQLTANQVFVNQQFQVVGTVQDADKLITASYKLLRNEVVVATKPVTALTTGTAGTWTIAFDPRTETATGSVTYRMVAVGTNGLDSISVAGDSVTVQVLTASPNSPTTVKIIRLP